ncbi:MAG: ElyC/SanA/YdcF family protein [Lachnospiraceae bacterium]|nr:ElyC/SanA/YdcF family protein [Lachnospiraceae bacterium]
MIQLIIGLVLLAAFAVCVRRDPRRFVNALLLIASALFLFYGVASLTQNIGWLQTLLLAFCYGLMPLVTLIFILLLFYDRFVMIKKEGKSLKNLLSAIFALCLLTGIIISFLLICGIFEKSMALDLFAWLIFMLCAYFSLSFVALMVYAQIYMLLPKKLDCDYIIIHGCGLSNGCRVTPLLRGRIDKAVEIYEKSGHHGKLVLSGGQGRDEKISEAKAMENYLREQGYTEEDFILEDRSTTTYENLKNVRDMLDTPDSKKKYLFVTNNYHVFRTSIFARKLGMRAEGVGCHTALYYWPSAFIREYIAIQVRYKWIAIAVAILWALLAINSVGSILLGR